MKFIIVDKEQRTAEGSANGGFLMKVFYRRTVADKGTEEAAKTMDSMFTQEWRKIVGADRGLPSG